MSRSDKSREGRAAPKPPRPAAASQVFGRFLAHVARLKGRQGKAARPDRAR